MDTWIDHELSGSAFKDKRLESRFREIVVVMSKGNGKTIPEVCEEWSMAKATYRFLSNDRVDESEILAGHFHQTSKRIGACKGPVLILHDTCEFVYKRKKPEDIGFTRESKYLNPNVSQKYESKYKVCGILMHASLAVSTDGLPLGLIANQFWTRKVFKGTRQMKRQINLTRVPIADKESIRWLEGMKKSNRAADTNTSRLIHIGDRENDIYEYLSECELSGAHYLVRSCVNRLAEESTIAEEMANHNHAYSHKIEFKDGDGNRVSTNLKIKVKTLTLHPPVDKQKEYTDLTVTMVSAVESDPPEDRERIKWTFLSNLPVTNREEAITVLGWYKQRWKVEMYFKILKSGLGAEESKLREASRLSKLISIFCIIAWRIQWLTMLNRDDEQVSPKLAFDQTERKILAHYFKKACKPKTLNDYINRLARLGGYLDRANDPPPGNTVIWKGLNKLAKLRAGFELAIDVGN